MKKTYAEKLRDPSWQKMRLKIMERDKFTCQFCHSNSETLNVHHKYYDKGAAPWEYDDGALVTLCELCHSDVESIKKEIGIISGDAIGMEALLNFVRIYKEEPQGFSGFLGMADGAQVVLIYSVFIAQWQRTRDILGK